MCLPEMSLNSEIILDGIWTAWDRLDYTPGYISAPSYEIHSIYGVFDFSASIIYCYCAGFSRF